MTSRKVTRRDVLRFAGLAGGAVLAAACGATPTAAPAATSAAVGATATTAAAAASPTVNVDMTAAAVAQKATEQAIALSAVTATPGADVLSMTAEQYNQSQKDAEAKASSEGKTIIELLSAYGTVAEDKTNPHYWIIQEFMAKNPNIYVKYSPSSAYTGGFNEVILMRIASGDPPDAIFHYSAPIAYAARGTCRAVDDLMDADNVCNKDAFPATTLAQVQWNGKTWGVPINGSMALMWYNTDMLAAKGLPTKREDLPKTLDELQALSAKVTEWDGDTMKVGGATPWIGNWAWPGSMVAAGGTGFWDGAKYSINDPKNAALLEYWLAWLDKVYKGDIDNLNKQGTLNNTYPEGAFGLGIQAICSDGFWSATHTPPERKYEVTQMPIGLTGTKHATSNYPNLMFIPTGAKHVKEAFQLTAYYSTEGQLAWWDRWSDVPYWKKFPEDKAPKDLIARVGQDKAVELTKFARAYIPEIVVQWNSPVDDFANDTISKAVDEVLHKTTAPQAALDSAQQQVDAKLKEAVAPA
jgi:ABC-type glycerol-3-phosphate transport system substrate-binding protein